MSGRSNPRLKAAVQSRQTNAMLICANGESKSIRCDGVVPTSVRFAFFPVERINLVPSVGPVGSSRFVNQPTGSFAKANASRNVVSRTANIVERLTNCRLCVIPPFLGLLVIVRLKNEFEWEFDRKVDLSIIVKPAARFRADWPSNRLVSTPMPVPRRALH